MSDLRMELIQGQLNDIEENVRSIKATWGNTIMTLDNIKSSLKADRQKSIEEAYQKGFEAGQHEATTLEYQQGLEEGKKQARAQAHLDVCHDIERVAHGNYQQGLDDAWNVARKIVTWPDRSLVNSDTFDLDPGENIFTKYSASRAIEKLKAYEESQKPDEIKVGDEVKCRADDCGVVTWIYGNDAYVLWQDGSTGNYAANELVKTGRHFNFLTSLLNAMKEGAE